VLEELARGVRDMVDGCCDGVRDGSVRLCEYGPAWAEDVVVEGVVEASDLPTVEGDVITVGAWHALDESWTRSGGVRRVIRVRNRRLTSRTTQVEIVTDERFEESATIQFRRRSIS